MGAKLMLCWDFFGEHGEQMAIAGSGMCDRNLRHRDISKRYQTSMEAASYLL
jgi:hypothetical protein